jgi:hypothetical protein
MEGTSVDLRLGLAPEVQEPPVNFFRASPNFAQFGNSHLNIDSTGELRETGGAWPLWLGFFCFEDRAQQFRQPSNIHSYAPCLIRGERLRYASLNPCLSRVDESSRRANLWAAPFRLFYDRPA